MKEREKEKKNKNNKKRDERQKPKCCVLWVFIFKRKPTRIYVCLSACVYLPKCIVACKKADSYSVNHGMNLKDELFMKSMGSGDHLYLW